jgi:hypothetical protein
LAPVIAEALGFSAEVGQRWSALNIEFSREASRELDLLDMFRLTKKPYPTGISAGNNVMPKVAEIHAVFGFSTVQRASLITHQRKLRIYWLYSEVVAIFW